MFDQAIKDKQEAYEELVEMSKNNHYTKENILHYLHHQNNYKLIGIDLSRQTGNTIPQQINLTRKSEEDSSETIFIDKKQQNNILNLSLDSLIITEKYKQ